MIETKKKKAIDFVPHNDAVLIEVDLAEERTPGGIILPEVARTKPARGTVRAVGEGRIMDGTGERADMGISVGDIVLFAHWGGLQVEIGREKLLVVKEKDILGVLYEEDEDEDEDEE